jgi:hypothetical protein
LRDYNGRTLKGTQCLYLLHAKSNPLPILTIKISPDIANCHLRDRGFKSSWVENHWIYWYSQQCKHHLLIYFSRYDNPGSFFLQTTRSFLTLVCFCILIITLPFAILKHSNLPNIIFLEHVLFLKGGSSRTWTQGFNLAWTTPPIHLLLVCFSDRVLLTFSRLASVMILLLSPP